MSRDESLALLPGLKLRPRSCLHIAQKRLLPRVLRMLLEEISRLKVRATRMAGAGYEAHIGGHLAVRRLPLHCSPGIVSVPSPLLHTARGGIDVSAEGPLIRLDLLNLRRGLLEAV